MKTTTKPVETTKEFKLEQAFVLWKNTSKAGKEYLKGKDFNGGKIIGYFNPNKSIAGRLKSEGNIDFSFFGL